MLKTSSVVRFQGQKSVSLSSTEAEYMAIFGVATEILYMAGILKFLGIPLNCPIKVNVDNIGAVYLSKNATTGSQAKHIDTRCHIVREYIEDWILKVGFVRLGKNHADIFTNNVHTGMFAQHGDAIWLKDFQEASTSKMKKRKGVEMGAMEFPTLTWTATWRNTNNQKRGEIIYMWNIQQKQEKEYDNYMNGKI